MAANELIANNENRKKKDLRSVIEKGELIHTLESVNPWEEAENIAHEIQINCISKQRNYNQYCILFRTNTQSKPFEIPLIAETCLIV